MDDNTVGDERAKVDLVIVDANMGDGVMVDAAMVELFIVDAVDAAVVVSDVEVVFRAAASFRSKLCEDGEAVNRIVAVNSLDEVVDDALGVDEVGDEAMGLDEVVDEVVDEALGLEEVVEEAFPLDLVVDCDTGFDDDEDGVEDGAAGLKAVVSEAVLGWEPTSLRLAQGAEDAVLVSEDVVSVT